MLQCVRDREAAGRHQTHGQRKCDVARNEKLGKNQVLHEAPSKGWIVGALDARNAGDGAPRVIAQGRRPEISGQPVGPNRSTRTTDGSTPRSTSRLLAASAKPADPHTNMSASGAASTSGSTSAAAIR